MIEGVKIINLKKIPDERGAIFHMLKNTDEHFTEFGEIYFSICYPGIIKGWHEHTKQTQNYCVIDGMMKLVLFDNRPKSTTYKKLQEIFLGDLNYLLVQIPPFVINGYKCVGEKKCIVANCSDLSHDPNEMIRHDPRKNHLIDYSWEVVHK
jgi:dTDP-4-dehydrorhamnose 3,5-epimerase